MNKSMKKVGMVLIGWMVGVGGLWADQTPPNSLLQDAEALAGQVSANENVSNFGGFSASSGAKSSSKKIKLRTGSKKTGTKKKSSKKSKKSTSKRSKSGKSRRKSKSKA